MTYRPNKKPVLLLDQDGPLAEWDHRWWDLVELFGMDAGGADRHTQQARYATNHLSERDAMIMAWIADNSYWYHDLPITDGAVEGVKELQQHFDVWVCTKPSPQNPGCFQGKADWLGKHFPDLIDKTFMAPNKTLVIGDVLLDDAPSVGDIDQATWKPVIFTAPFNGDGSEWEKYPHWCWGDGIEMLLGLVEEK